jgi:Fe-S cluster assembly iron-binding protein IscA
MLTLTPSAVQAVDALLHSNPEIPDDAGLRIAPTGESEFSLGIVSGPAPGDQIIEDGGARVFVDEQAAPLIDGAQLDAQAQGDQIAFGLAPQGAGPSANGPGPG